MSYSGENFVILCGEVIKPSYKPFNGGFGEGGFFNATLKIPTSDGRFQYIKIGAKGKTALTISDLHRGAFIKMHGHIEERSYDGKCRHCNGPDRKYWTEVHVDNYILIGG